ncbi:phosphate ABC transporter substrate-binding protein PstS [Dermatophilus congolensis]|uniref:phosphate ABC transporter substrate-binding protein PstS n=1 Tax=Dermatophilus congolensis TaxID=1863 RepID=UPI001E610F54|nr:phosphate ABC transporter substrate-binding protein PstS [Dermatophilus congolensis]
MHTPTHSHQRGTLEVKFAHLRRTLAVTTLIALAATVAACSVNGSKATSGNGAGVSGSIAGAGASSQQAAVAAWKVGFESDNPNSTINYDPVGSGGGRTQFLNGGVQFAGSDAYLKKEELAKVTNACARGELIEAPVYISPIAVAYRISGITDLQLSAPVIADIFSGNITKWNDPKIIADNPGKTMPDLTITPVHRSDESGTTQNFTDYLNKAAPQQWPHKPHGSWPLKGGEAAKGTAGVVQAIKAGDGTIGYADESQVADLGKAKVKVGSEYVTISAEAATKIIDSSPVAAGRPQYSHALDIKRDTTEAGNYPIVLTSYALACTKYKDKQTAELVKSWLTYIFSEDGQKAAQQSAGSAPISNKTREAAMKGINAITTAN